MPDPAYPKPFGAASGAPAAVPLIELNATPAAVGAPEASRERDGTTENRPVVIALGSPKGGTGKSTTAMLLAVALLKLGYRVGSIDLDGQQATMSRYLANRAALTGETGEPLEMPRHYRIEPSLRTSRELGEQEEKRRIQEALRGLADCDYVVIDTPGSDCHMSRLGCIAADTVVTPLNDSLLDIDVLARIDPRKRLVLGPSEYSRAIWQENDDRVASDRRPIDWVVIRNRLGHVEARNTRQVSCLLQQLAHRLGFRLAAGLGERVAFRELFLNGLTPLDLPNETVRHRTAPRSALAHREVAELLEALGISSPCPGLDRVC